MFNTINCENQRCEISLDESMLLYDYVALLSLVDSKNRSFLAVDPDSSGEAGVGAPSSISGTKERETVQVTCRGGNGEEESERYKQRVERPCAPGVDRKATAARVI